MEKCADIKELEEIYEKEKYNLPEFKKLTEDFEIEEIENITSFPLRDIRKMINNKISNYLHLLETFLNPSASPMFVFSMLKNISEEDRKTIKEIYKQLTQLGINALQIDINYNEKSEADYIRETFKIWQELKPRISKLFKNLGNSFEKEGEDGSRGYVG